MHIVVAVLLDRSTQDQIRASLAHHVHVQVYSCRRRALAALRRLPAVALLTDLAADSSMPAETFVRLVHQQSPRLPVVAVVHLTNVDLRALLRIAPIGVDGVIAAGVDSPWSVLESVIVSPAIDASVETVLATLRPRVGDRAWAIVPSVVGVSTTPVTVDDWSTSLGVHRTTLRRKLESAGLRGPATTLTLTRLLVAVQLIGVHRWTVENTSAALHYSSAAALRRSLQLHSGVSPHGTRVPGGVDRAMSAIVAKLSPSIEKLA